MTYGYQYFGDNSSYITHPIFHNLYISFLVMIFYYIFYLCGISISSMVYKCLEGYIIRCIIPYLRITFLYNNGEHAVLY